MATIIYSKHLKLLKLLYFIKEPDFNFLELFLNVSKPNLKLYLKEIYSHIPNNTGTNKTKSIIKEILNSENIFTILKKTQSLSKEERITLLILELLINQKISLKILSKKLSVSRRILNFDLIYIKNYFNEIGLVIESKIGDGIFLLGDNFTRKKTLFSYIYKLLIEREFLSQMFKTHFSFLFYNDKLNSTLKKDIETFLTICNIDIFFKNRELLSAFYISFKYLDNNYQNSKNTLKFFFSDFRIFKFFFSNLFPNSDLNKLHNFLLNSIFSELKFQDILFFEKILKLCSGSLIESNTLNKNLKIWENCFNKNFNLNEKIFLEKLISKILIENDFFIQNNNLFFLSLNISKSSIDNCLTIFNKLNNYYPNICLSDVFSSIIFLKNNYQPKAKVVFLYSNIPLSILKSLKNHLEEKYNIDILNFIHIYSFDSTKIISSVDVVTLENFTNLTFKITALKV
ncbi:MAG: hypothetical protein ACRC4T_23135 [Cetobacterium sp.]